MILLKIVRTILTIVGVGNFQDTTSINIHCPLKQQGYFKQCSIKQNQINDKAILLNAKLDSIEYKWDKLMELIKNDTTQ